MSATQSSSSLAATNRLRTRSGAAGASADALWERRLEARAQPILVDAGGGWLPAAWQFGDGIRAGLRSLARLPLPDDGYGSPLGLEAPLPPAPGHHEKRGLDDPRQDGEDERPADHDDRVFPGHSFKFAAALQTAQAGEKPVLIRIETRAGHGGGMPISKQIELNADRWAFLVRNLGMTPSP